MVANGYFGEARGFDWRGGVFGKTYAVRAMFLARSLLVVKCLSLNTKRDMACIILILKSRSGVTLDLFFIDTAAAPLYVEAVGGAYYQFSDEATGFAPPRLQTAREGDALRVSFGDGPALVIGHYFSRGAGALIGLQEGGGMRRYADAPSAMPLGRACEMRPSC